ncbi:hypothetical protein [Pseudonocardia abyssalis]|uniref:Uncharacterized protein n=1 Tax=Pseudonocardia abyssalis TaxID=2792008 RepID=A0ABS6US98_9PSEU|nr:hypothetical protein [Pseudonocardia abyssalis]MBW0113864.1 hypothetical protein [Pseudonocardia abyssalis]MBW0135139.1 hypothetical protein [Pseudonocardia abyssalis]
MGRGTGSGPGPTRHTAVDTSGFLGERASDGFLHLVDLFLLDIKSGDPDTHRLVASAELEPTPRIARRLSDRGNRMWVRFVLVAGLTDAPGNVDAVKATRCWCPATGTTS